VTAAPAREERELVGVLVRTARAVELVMPRLRPDHFAGELERLVYSACCRVIEAGDPFGASAVLRAAGGRVPPDYLVELMADSPPAETVDWYLERVLEAAARRRLQEALDAARVAAADPAVPVEEARRLAEAAVRGAEATVHIDEPRPYWEDLGDHLVALEKRRAGDRWVVSTGLPWIERMTGGWRRGQLVVVGGQSSAGKSLLGLQFARWASDHGRKVLYVLLEMTAEQLRDRLIAAKAQVDIRRLEDGRFTAEEWDRILTAVGRATEGRPHLVIDERCPTTLAAIQERCRRAARRDGVDMVVVDYVGQVAQSRASQTRYEHVSEIARGLKALALELRAPVVALSQLNRLTTGRPTLENLRESGELGNNADIVLLIHRPTNGGGASDEIELGLVKHRNGPRGWAKFRLVGAEMTVREEMAG
jgi:replicative DNA helicase